MRTTLAISIVAGLALPAHAQPGADLVLQASAKATRGDHAGAADLYRQAYVLDGDARLLAIIGGELRLAGDGDGAKQYLCAYLAAERYGATAAGVETQLDLIGRGPCATPELDKPRLAPRPVETTPPLAPNAEAIPLSHREVAGLVTAGAGLVALSIAAYYAHAAGRFNDQIDQHDPALPWPAQLDGVPTSEWSQHGRDLNQRATVSAIVGGVAVMTGAALFASGRYARLAEHVTITSAATGGGIAFGGGF
jgi:hypothetical protein